MTATGIVLIVIAVAVIAVLGWYLARERRSKQLRSRFGPEYEYAMREYGDRHKAEDALHQRQQRREKIHVRPLSHEEHDRFAREWHDVQARFVDDPPGSTNRWSAAAHCWRTMPWCAQTLNLDADMQERRENRMP